MTPEGLAQAMTALLAAAGIALALALVLLSRYRRRIVALMRANRGADSTRRPHPTSDASARPIQLDIIQSVGSAAVATNSIYDSVSRGPARAIFIHGIGVALFAALMAAVYLIAENILSATRWVVMFAILAWPVVIIAFLITPPASRSRKWTIVFYFVGMTAVLLFAAAISPDTGFLNLLVSWLLLNGPPTLLLSAFTNRKVRAVGPLALVFALISVTGAILALALLHSASSATSSQAAQGFFGLAAAAGMSGLEVLIWFIVIGFVVAAIMGWLAVRWFAARYRAGRLTDQSMSVDAAVLFYGIYHSIMLAYVLPIAILSGLIAFVAFRFAVNTGTARIRATATSSAANLLYLRVFALGARSERMFDAITRGWRYAGNVQLIAGPDLATSTVEPHEFLDFLSGRIATAFIGSNENLERRLADIAVVAGRDRRYGVNDFFCYDNTWRMTLAALTERNSMVFMDARGFSTQNPGVIFELNQLVNAVPLDQCLLAVDRTTDLAFLQQVIEEAWSALAADSPNRLSTDPRIRAVSVDALDQRSLDLLMRYLSGAGTDSHTP